MHFICMFRRLMKYRTCGMESLVTAGTLPPSTMSAAVTQSGIEIFPMINAKGYISVFDLLTLLFIVSFEVTSDLVA